jgi:hypothetical protein
VPPAAARVVKTAPVSGKYGPDCRSGSFPFRILEPQESFGYFTRRNALGPLPQQCDNGIVKWYLTGRCASLGVHFSGSGFIVCVANRKNFLNKLFRKCIL